MTTMTLIKLFSQPVWILVGLIGVADILIFLWCISLICRNRNNQACAAGPDEFALLPDPPMQPAQFQQNLTCMQIDAVFDGLAALIETERIKLKSMMQPLVPPLAEEPIATQEVKRDLLDAVDNFPQREAPELPLDQQITKFAALGKKPADIASQLGISLTEVALAVRMHTSEQPRGGHKLEAVA
jgi:hypothetical protein